MSESHHLLRYLLTTSYLAHDTVIALGSMLTDFQFEIPASRTRSRVSLLPGPRSYISHARKGTAPSSIPQHGTVHPRSRIREKQLSSPRGSSVSAKKKKGETSRLGASKTREWRTLAFASRTNRLAESHITLTCPRLHVRSAGRGFIRSHWKCESSPSSCHWVGGIEGVHVRGIECGEPGFCSKTAVVLKARCYLTVEGALVVS